MVRCAHDDNVRGQIIYLKEQRAHNALDFSGLMDVASLFPNGVKLVEEEHAPARVSEIKETPQSRGRFAEVAGDESIVPNHYQGDHQCACEGLGKRGFPVARSAREEETVARVKVVRTEQICSMVLLNEFIDRGAHSGIEDQISQGSPRAYLVD